MMLAALACCAASCTHSRQQEALDRAESIMEAHPDSALSILNGIEKSELSSKAVRARYALLMSMALDKNYIDTTTFDVLQPAIDYYLKKGNADEKLRTYYYKGVIFLNRGDRDQALNSFVKGTHISNQSNDSLAIARLLVAQGGIYHDLYEIDSFVRLYLEAAGIYKSLLIDDSEFDCLINALNGSILLENRHQCDSILNLLNKFKKLNLTQEHRMQIQQLSYALKFGSEDEIRNLIHIQEENIRSQNDLYYLALAYTKIEDNDKASLLLDHIVTSGQPYDTIRYLSVSVPALEGAGCYKEALDKYKRFSHKQDSLNLLKFEKQTQIIEEKHQIELKSQEDSQRKSQIIWGCVAGIVILTMGFFILLLLLRSNKAKRDLAIQKAKTAELENERLKSDAENLALENRNLQLERDKKALKAENLSHRVEALESENDSLKELLDTKEELPPEVKKEIQVRIEMLNSLLASYITDNEQYERCYEAWVKELTVDTDAFMNSNRLAFQASHPRFIQYFEDHGLTVDEINYVCLYAIGLRGKEVGNYMKKRSHVNISSAIRKKLGIDKHETNIGIYVRKLLKNL